jgi:L-iditol 2-dehydrogenase
MMAGPAAARAVRLTRPGQHELVEVEVPAPAADEVLVRVAATGICGSDVELFDGRRPAAFVRYPVVPGHEWAGRVVAAGAAVRHVAVGDPVVAEGIRSCGVCPRCRDGDTNLCSADYAETGFTHPGAFSDFVVVPGRLVHRLPDTRPLEQAALLEPAACVIGGVLAAAPPAGARVVVIGGGTLGLLAVQLFAMHSPSELVVVGRRAGALAVAGELGATRTVRVPDQDAGWLEERADVVFEAAGNPAAVPQALAVARRGGTVVLEGIAGQGAVAMDPDVFALKHLQVHGVFAASSRAWRHAVGLFGAGLLRLGPLITHRFALQDYTLALATLAARGSDTRKVLLVPGDGEGGSAG